MKKEITKKNLQICILGSQFEKTPCIVRAHYRGDRIKPPPTNNLGFHIFFRISKNGQIEENFQN